MKFHYWGRELEGLDHPYNTTALNERAVEIPIAVDWLNQRPGDHGLEVGNVLSHYGYQGHRVVDRYELADGVDNIDVLAAAGHYDWIVSISTLEHVGLDEDVLDPDAAGRALTHLVGLLRREGRMLVTIPAGYHQALDIELAFGVGTTRACTLVRSGARWVQTVTPMFLPYGPNGANSVWVGEWQT